MISAESVRRLGKDGVTLGSPSEGVLMGEKKNFERLTQRCVRISVAQELKDKLAKKGEALQRQRSKTLQNSTHPALI